MASNVYAHAKYLAATDNLGWGNPARVFRGMLVTAGYTFNHVHTHVSDVVASEVMHASYSRVTIAGRTVTLDLPGDRALLNADDALFTDLAVVIPSGLIIYKQIGGNDLTPGDDPLICFVDFPPTPASGAGFTFLVEFSPSGVLALTAC
jgi:hypothetical protein